MLTVKCYNNVVGDDRTDSDGGIRMLDYVSKKADKADDRQSAQKQKSAVQTTAIRSNPMGRTGLPLGFNSSVKPIGGFGMGNHIFPKLQRYPLMRTCQLVKIGGGGRWLTHASFNVLLKPFFLNRINDASWELIKDTYCELNHVDQNSDEFTDEKRAETIDKLDDIVSLCVLYRELGQRRYFESEPNVQKWSKKDGSPTDKANEFVQNYEDIFNKEDSTRKYQSAIAKEIEMENCKNPKETEYTFNREENKVENLRPDADKVIYRAMKLDDYKALKTYFDQIKVQIDNMYDRGVVDAGVVNGLHDNIGGKLPLGAHLGDFEQVAGYLHRQGEKERILVKFFIKGNKKNCLVDNVNLPPERGGEGYTSINKHNHALDKIGTKLEDGNKFSYYVGTSKWAAFRFLTYVEKIEVMNPWALRGGGNRA